MANTSILKMDLVCRTCLNESDNMKSIFIDDGDDIFKMLQVCSGLNIHALDGFPANICSDCLDKVHISYDFRQQCEIAHNAVVNFLGTKMKRLSVDQYNMHEDILDDNHDEIYETDVKDANMFIINGKESELSVEDDHSIMNDTKSGVVEEEYISIDSNLSVIILKDEHNNKGSDNECNNPFRDDILFSDDSGNHDNQSLTQSKYYQHLNSDKEVKLHQCDQCGKHFARNENLQRHRMTHLKSIAHKPYKCDQCVTAFTRKDNYRRHCEKRHGDGIKKPTPPKTEICEICQKAFTTPKNLHFHMKAHRAKDKLNKQKVEKLAEELSDSQKNHVKERPFLCSECGLRFDRNDYLVIHMRRHKGEKPYKCRYCDKAFPRSSDRTMHEVYHIGEKKHLCTICGKGFHRAYNLIVHTRVHTGERPYKCPHCDKSFTQANDLKAHVRRHTGELFKCDICGEGFVHGYHLRHHRRNQHGIDEKSHIGRLQKFTKPRDQN